MSEAAKKEEAKKESFGVEECEACNVNEDSLRYHQNRIFLLGSLFCVIMFLTTVCGIVSVGLLSGSGIGLFALAGAFFVGIFGFSEVSSYIYLIEHNGQTHCHSTAPTLHYGNNWHAAVWNETEKALREEAITGPIIRLAFGGWFKTSKILNGWSHVKIGRPFVKTFDNNRLELFVTISHRDDYGAGPRFREALVVNQYEVMDLVKRITASELQVTRMVFRTLQNTERALDLSDRVVERMTGQFTVMSKAHEQLREEGNEAYQKFLRADSDAGALFERVRQITAGMAGSKRVNNSPIAGIAREALETMLEVICAEGAEEPVKESKERIQMLLEKMGDLPEPLRQQGVPAGKVAAQK